MSRGKAALALIGLLAAGCSGAYVPPPLPAGHPALATTPPAPPPPVSTALPGDGPILPPPAGENAGPLGHERPGHADHDAHDDAHTHGGHR